MKAWLVPCWLAAVACAAPDRSLEVCNGLHQGPCMRATDFARAWARHDLDWSGDHIPFLLAGPLIVNTLSSGDPWMTIGDRAEGAVSCPNFISAPGESANPVPADPRRTVVLRGTDVEYYSDGLVLLKGCTVVVPVSGPSARTLP